jgi:hypothetical protein
VRYLEAPHRRNACPKHPPVLTAVRRCEYAISSGQELVQSVTTHWLRAMAHAHRPNQPLPSSFRKKAFTSASVLPSRILDGLSLFQFICAKCANFSCITVSSLPEVLSLGQTRLMVDLRPMNLNGEWTLYSAWPSSLV